METNDEFMFDWCKRTLYKPVTVHYPNGEVYYGILNGYMRFKRHLKVLGNSGTVTIKFDSIEVVGDNGATIDSIHLL